MSRLAQQPATLTLQQHLSELRIRLLWIVAWLSLGSLGGYLIKDQVIDFLMAPLKGASLVYLTPIGGFNFLFRICLYFGLAVTVPAMMYQVFRFLEPLMRRRESVVGFLFFSVVLALAGGLFAYYVTLPAALHFLMNFETSQVKAMLTVDSYLTFVVTYVLGFAVLFQIPLVLLMLNAISPLPPGRLLGLQRVVIVLAFVVAAVISPTPDAANQVIMAAPMIAMYEVGVASVWVQNRARRGARGRAVVPGLATRDLTATGAAVATVAMGGKSPKSLGERFGTGSEPAPFVHPLRRTGVVRQPRRMPQATSSRPAKTPIAARPPAAATRRASLAMDIAPRSSRQLRTSSVMTPTAHRRSLVSVRTARNAQTVPAPAAARPIHYGAAPHLRVARWGSVDGMRALPAPGSI